MANLGGMNGAGVKCTDGNINCKCLWGKNYESISIVGRLCKVLRTVSGTYEVCQSI